MKCSFKNNNLTKSLCAVIGFTTIPAIIYYNREIINKKMNVLCNDRKYNTINNRSSFCAITTVVTGFNIIFGINYIKSATTCCSTIRRAALYSIIIVPNTYYIINSC